MKAAEQLIALQTIVRKELRRIFQIWVQTILPPVITMGLYFIIFGTFLGSQISDMQGVSYIMFILPGLVMMPIITNAFMNVVASFYISKFQRNIEELLISPVPNHIIVLGYAIGGIIRALIIGVLVLIIAMFFTSVQIHNLFIILVFAILTAMVFALGGFINAVYARNFDDVNIVPTFVLTPLTYLGGVFYSIEYLPSFWQKVSLFNPILYMVDGFRYGFIGVSDVPVLYGISILGVLCIVLFAGCMYLLKKGTGLKN